MTTKIVIDLGYGDSGKGLVTDYLASINASANGVDKGIVVRFNGGPQAGHTVYREDGKKHVFSHFGSGTFQGYTTFWSKYCPINPTALFEERSQLYSECHTIPILIVDPLCPIITPYDIAYNQTKELSRGHSKHGSVGVGFGSTIERHEHSPHKLYAQDLKYSTVLEYKLASIRAYYHLKTTEEGIFIQYQNNSFNSETSRSTFMKDATHFTIYADIKKEKDVFDKNRHFPIIFEGAQGILLDMDHGFFPHVTRSNTTSKNAMEIITRNNLNAPEVYYVTRAYQTRHGAGPMTNEDHKMKSQILDNPLETNQMDDWQGHFRKGVLDLQLLQYAVECDGLYFPTSCQKNLVITCMDHMKNQLCTWTDGYDLINQNASPEELRDQLLYPTAGLYTSHSHFGYKIYNHSKKLVNSL